MSTRPLRNLDIPDYDSRQPSDILTLILLIWMIKVLIIKKQKKRIEMMNQFELQSIALIIIMIDISHKSMQLKNGQQINEELGKAVNAAISIITSKKSMVK